MSPPTSFHHFIYSSPSEPIPCLILIQEALAEDEANKQSGLPNSYTSSLILPPSSILNGNSKQSWSKDFSHSSRSASFDTPIQHRTNIFSSSSNSPTKQHAKRYQPYSHIEDQRCIEETDSYQKNLQVGLTDIVDDTLQSLTDKNRVKSPERVKKEIIKEKTSKISEVGRRPSLPYWEHAAIKSAELEDHEHSDPPVPVHLIYSTAIYLHNSSTSSTSSSRSASIRDQKRNLFLSALTFYTAFTVGETRALFDLFFMFHSGDGIPKNSALASLFYVAARDIATMKEKSVNWARDDRVLNFHQTIEISEHVAAFWLNLKPAFIRASKTYRHSGVNHQNIVLQFQVMHSIFRTFGNLGAFDFDFQKTNISFWMQFGVKEFPAWRKADSCMSCHKGFSFPFRRRHHCRNCGRSLCHKCSPCVVQKLPRWGVKGDFSGGSGIRTCIGCFEICDGWGWR